MYLFSHLFAYKHALCILCGLHLCLSGAVDAIHPSYHGYDFSPKFDRNAVSDNTAYDPPTPSPSDVLTPDTQSAYATTPAASPPTAYEPTSGAPPPAPAGASVNDSIKTTQLQRMVQQLYAAQAQVQLEAAEIQRAQTIASAAQQQLDDASNNVRVITAALRAAQETVATAALRAQTGQLQLSAHDQLLFTARQHVDALSAQMVGLQAELGIAGGDQRMSVDLPALLNRLRAPLPADEQPKPATGLGPTVDKQQSQQQPQQQQHALVIHSAGTDGQPGRLINVAEQPTGTTRKRSALLDPEFTAGNVHDLLSWVRRAKDDDVARAVASADGMAAAAASSARDGMGTDYDGEVRRQRYVNDFVAKMRRLSSQSLNSSAYTKGMGEERQEWKNVRAQKNADLIRRTMEEYTRTILHTILPSYNGYNYTFGVAALAAAALATALGASWRNNRN